MKENYRKAAHVMFECGSRLGLELVTVAGLKKQVLSITLVYSVCLAALPALYLTLVGQ